jgi:hypothetical protein
MSIVEKIEEGIESGVKAVEKFFTGETEDVKGEVEGAADTLRKLSSPKAPKSLLLVQRLNRSRSTALAQRPPRKLALSIVVE